MPRPPESTPLRRFLEQAIMWVVLIGTVGAAALVNVELGRLGPRVTFNGMSLQLPKNWHPTEDDGDGQIARRERGEEWFARSMTITHFTPALSLQALFARSRPLHSEQVDVADGAAAKITAILHRAQRLPTGEGAPPELEVFAVLSPPRGRVVVISISQLAFNPRADTDLNVKLMKRILATARFADEQD